MKNYGISRWSDGNFFIDKDLVKVNYKSKPSMYEIVNSMRNQGLFGPLLLRFPHLIEKQIDTLYGKYNKWIAEYNYHGEFKAVFPLKVNQFANFIEPLVDIGTKYNYGLEAGSKAELIIAIAMNNKNAPITVNGFKDRELITLGFIASSIGYDITLIIESIEEIKDIVLLSKEFNKSRPNIGIRIKLHSNGSGIWAKSGGIDSKFGLSSTELIEALEVMQDSDMINCFKMIHFHIGSQLSEIKPLKKAIREAGHVYAQLRNMGAKSLDSINIGGGLAVEYSQNDSRDRLYTLDEFASDVIFSIKSIAKNQGVKEPDIYTEAGRYISASHSVLIAPVIELFSQEHTKAHLKLKKFNPALIEELNELYLNINRDNAQEYLHDALDHMESLFTLFDLGYIDLQDRSNTEILVQLIIRKALILLEDKNYKELKNISNKIQEKYLVNFSIFQSIPDFWGLGQKFPIMPLSKLDISPTRAASLWDITCDSDGEVGFDTDNPLYLHNIDIDDDDYFIGIFLVGAYQEVLGMNHNLFSHPTEATIEINDSGYDIMKIVKSQTIKDTIKYLRYSDLELKIINKIRSDKLLSQDYKDLAISKLNRIVSDSSYLKNFHNKS